MINIFSNKINYLEKDKPEVKEKMIWKWRRGRDNWI